MPRIHPVDVATAPRETVDHLEPAAKCSARRPICSRPPRIPQSPSAPWYRCSHMSDNHHSARKSANCSASRSPNPIGAPTASPPIPPSADHWVFPRGAVVRAQAESVDRHTMAALKLAVAINESRGHIDDATLAGARAAGLSDAEISKSSHMSRSTCSRTI